MSSEQGIEGTTFKVYLYLVKEAKPLGPRDVTRGLELSSPSVAYRHLQKLESLGVIQKDLKGDYVVKEKTPFEGYIWIGRNLMPRLLFYSFFFVGLLMVELIVVEARVVGGTGPIELELIFLILVTASSTALFMVEGSILLQRLKKYTRQSSP